MSVRCIFTSWILAWAVAVFLPSAVIAAMTLESEARTPTAFLGTTWQVADAVGPAVKLVVGAVLLAGGIGIGRMIGRLPLEASVLIGIAATLAPLAIVPRAWSRGYGAEIAGFEFDATLLLIYALGGAIGGAVMSIAARRCHDRRR